MYIFGVWGSSYLYKQDPFLPWVMWPRIRGSPELHVRTLFRRVLHRGLLLQPHLMVRRPGLGFVTQIPKGPKYLYGTKYGFCSSNFPYGLGKYSPYGYLGPFGDSLAEVLT